VNTVLGIRPEVVRAVRAIGGSSYLIAFTGAGVSAESGIPTFRGPGGLWRRYKPEELASPEGFKRNPRLVWEWYAWRMQLVERAKPNKAHILLSRLEESGILKCIITQNVDGLHQRSGSKNVIELHGNIWRARCIECYYTTIHHEPPPKESLPPTCPRCGALLRPDVVWFGEPLPSGALARAYSEAANADVVLVIGTSGAVEPAGSIPLIAWHRGAHIINVDPNPNRYDGISYVNIKAKATAFAEAVAREMGITL